jgi:hypothetical protein
MIKKSIVALVALQYELFVLQFVLFATIILQIETMSDFILYTKSIVAFLMPLLTTV